ncbi:hypothetical protein PIB30_106835, partial [Stylosanthes scabra]|nr:hypothetical protein [Stylosanthes scabra]
MIGFPFIKALTYIKPFFSAGHTSLPFTAFMSWTDPTHSATCDRASRSSVIDAKVPSLGQSFIWCGPLHTKHPPLGTNAFFFSS